MSPAEWGVLVTVLIGVPTLGVGIAALHYARRATTASEEELKLAKELAEEQARQRPNPVLVFRKVTPHHRPETPGSPRVPRRL